MKWYNLLLITSWCLISCKDADSGQDNTDKQEQNYSGPGYVTGLKQSAANVLFAVEVPQPGNYLLEMKYRNTGTTDATASISINNTPANKEVQLLAQANNNLWQSAETDVSLQNGINYIIIQNGTPNSGIIELDYIKLRMKP